MRIIIWVSLGLLSRLTKSKELRSKDRVPEMLAATEEYPQTMNLTLHPKP